MRADVLPGKRFRDAPDGENWYVGIFGNEDGPLELWSTVPDENKPEMQRSRSNIQFMCALLQIGLEHGVDPYLYIEAADGAITETAPKAECEAIIVANALFQYMEGEREGE